jgi:hypothetical protein
MSRINVPAGKLFKVVLTEYECGWGQREFDVLYFDDESEAKRYADDFNFRHNCEPVVPDWYVRAEFMGC